MALESATHINQLVSTNPTGGDQKSGGDDHIRMLKAVLQTDFPGITGPVTATQAELNILDGATTTVAEINQLVGNTSLLRRSTSLLYSNSTVSTYNNSAASTNIFTYTVLGGVLGTLGGLRLELLGKAFNGRAVAENFFLEVKYGTGIIRQSTINPLAVINGALDLHVPYKLIIDLWAKGATNAQISFCTVEGGIVDGALLGGYGYNSSGGGGTIYDRAINAGLVQDSTVNKDLTVNVKFDTADALLEHTFYAARLFDIKYT